MPARILQLCPHDEMPFGALCARFARAAEMSGAQVTTVFLGAADGEPLAGAEYLDAPDMSDTAELTRRLQPWADTDWDLILCHRYRSYLTALKARLRGRRKVALAHEYGILQRWQRRLLRKLRGSDFEFAGVAPGLVEELARVTGHRLLLANALGGPEEIQPLAREAARVELGLADDDLIIGVVGRLHYKKRPLLALQAFEQFSRSHPDSRLVFLGDGEQRAELVESANPRVLVPGVVPDAARLYRAFDVLLHTANAEPFGMVILEAMNAGVPVVCARGHGPQYILGELGVYADEDTAAALADALTRSLQVDRQKFAASSRARIAQEFSIQALSNRLAELL